MHPRASRVAKVVVLRPSSAGTAGAEALQASAFDALVTAPDQLVIDLQGTEETPELRAVVAALASKARRQHCRLTVQRD